MYVIIPEEKRKLQRIYRPYLDGTSLKEDAPKEVVEAFEEFFKWFEEVQGNEQ